MDLLEKITAMHDPLWKFTQATATEPGGARNKEQESMCHQHQSNQFANQHALVFGRQQKDVSVCNKYIS